MWKNKCDRESVALIKSVFIVKGRNLDGFINLLRNRKIAVYDVKKVSNDKLILAVNFKDYRKFFAIGKELCYNIKKVRDKGKGYPFLALYRSLGILIGAIIICFCAYTCSDYIFDFKFTGSGSVYYRQIGEYLNEKGIKKLSRFSSLNLEKLEDEILADNPNLSFVSCLKVGNRLVIDSALSQDRVDKVKGDVYKILSDVDGVIESLKVYRGTAVVSVGDSVRAGDLLVDGYVIIKDVQVKTNVLACISLSCFYEYVYVSERNDCEEKAILLAEQQLGDKTITQNTVIKNPISDNQFEYIVKLTYKHVLRVG